MVGWHPWGGVCLSPALAVPRGPAETVALLMAAWVVCTPTCLPGYSLASSGLCVLSLLHLHVATCRDPWGQACILLGTLPHSCAHSPWPLEMSRESGRPVPYPRVSCSLGSSGLISCKTVLFCQQSQDWAAGFVLSKQLAGGQQVGFPSLGHPLPISKNDGLGALLFRITQTNPDSIFSLDSVSVCACTCTHVRWLEVGYI